MEAEGLEALSRHLAAKIGLIKRLLQLRGLGRRALWGGGGGGGVYANEGVLN